MPNLTLNEFYNPNIIFLSKLIMDFDFILYFSMLPFILFVIIKKSKSMEVYRWYLINCLVWDSLTVFLVGLISPLPLGVYPIFVISSAFEQTFNIQIWYTLLGLCLYCNINLVTGVAMSVGYRMIYLLNLSDVVVFKWQPLKLFDRPSCIKALIGIIQIIALCNAYFLFEAHRSSVLSNGSYEYYLKDFPFLEEIFSERKTIG